MAGIVQQAAKGARGRFSRRQHGVRISYDARPGPESAEI